MLIAGWQLVQSSLSELDVLAIEDVNIEGELAFLSSEQMIQEVMPLVDGGFFNVDLTGIRSHLIALPWVEDVSIRRQWPNGLLLRVIEKQPAAYWGGDQLVSSRAVLFKPENLDRSMAIPKLIGPEGQHSAMLKELGRLQAWLADTGLRIEILHQDARRSWSITMESGFELRLGRRMRNERIQRFADAYEKRLMKQAQQVRHVDMRYTNGFAVAWKQG